MFCSIYSVFIVPNGTLQLSTLRFFRAFSSVVRQMPGYNWQRQVTAHTLLNEVVNCVVLVVNCVVLLLIVLFLLLIVLFYVLFACKCVLYYCHRVPTQLQLTNISYRMSHNDYIFFLMA